MVVLNFIRGLCMAIADSVPGVSGGTIAFILGFYDDFLNSINAILYGEREDKKLAFRFLMKIGVGWLTGFILSVLFITSVFERNIYEISSLFLGFVATSIPLIMISEFKTLRDNKGKSFFLILGMCIVAAMTYLNPILSEGYSFSIRTENLNLLFIIYLFLAGMIAISAMVLPGISGSTILLIFGLYVPILNGIKQVLKLQFNYLPALIIFTVGILFGVLMTVKIVRKLLNKNRGEMMYFIIGLMIGSLYAVTVGPTSLENPKPAMNMSLFDLKYFIIGGVLIPILEIVKRIRERKMNKKLRSHEK